MPDTEKITQEEATQHLALVTALSSEVSLAISAIERNDMTELESRIAAQETICQKLAQQDPERLKRAFNSYKSAAETPSRTTLFDKVREAHLALARLNRVYAGIVGRSQRSIELIANFYRNYGQRYSKDESAPPAKHTWSCEV
ncbi:MAG TPA: hypothetical protein VMT67_03560 [Terriglobales bacterium]|nr:hypothetical protein [Terriglobales bacterium]